MNEFVDIRINNCRFGYGGIFINISYQMISFCEIKPPVGAGNYVFDKEDNIKIGDWEFTGNKLTIFFDNLDDVQKFETALDKTEELKGGFFKFKDVILDFTKYEQASLDIVRNAVKRVKLNIISLSAC